MHEDKRGEYETSEQSCQDGVEETDHSHLSCEEPDRCGSENNRHNDHCPGSIPSMLSKGEECSQEQNQSRHCIVPVLHIPHNSLPLNGINDGCQRNRASGLIIGYRPPIVNPLQKHHPVANLFSAVRASQMVLENKNQDGPTRTQVTPS